MNDTNNLENLNEQTSQRSPEAVAEPLAEAPAESALPPASEPGGEPPAAVDALAMVATLEEAPQLPVPELAAERLRHRCDPALFAFETTTELDDLPNPLGQQRAVDAVRFGVEIDGPGYNLFVLGPSGVGKRSLVSQVLDREARQRPAPYDWCYVNNFEQPSRPVVLQLPAGRGKPFARAVRHLVDELRQAVPAAFDSDEYRGRREQVDGEFGEREAAAFNALGHDAEEKGIALLRTPSGFGLAPVKDGEVITPDEYEKLPDEEKTRLAGELEVLHAKLAKIIRQLPQWAREKRERIKALNREFTLLAVGQLVEELRQAYADLPAVLSFLDALHQDVIENGAAFRKGGEGGGASGEEWSEISSPFRRYEVNLLVDNGETLAAPVTYLDHPTYQNLVGRVEHRERMGALFTDFTLIKAGALHRANGGYLILDARKLLTQPFAWDALKRALDSRHVRPDSIGQVLSLTSTFSLEPEPIPLDVKVVLLGERIIYYLLLELDPDFGELFKVVADFEDSIDRDADSAHLYARLAATVGRREKLLPFRRDAVARLVERSTRLAEDAEKLSTHVQPLVDLMRESDYWARQEHQELVTGEHVERAVAAQRKRVDRIHERVQEAILRGTLMIDTEDARVGQINGLSVLDMRNFRFGQPMRITATVRVGEGEVIDIQREVELGGAVHSKGVMILSSFLAMRYSSETPLSLTATLVFEQTYEMVEGDSASLAELCALLSALGVIPIRQSLAVTGSVDQYGQVQAIGGVNEKIEGFFDICQARGLTGEQGVLIPAANVKHLMLREDIVDAVAAGRFHVHAVATVDEAIELLTGLPAGEPDEQGLVKPGTVNFIVASRLADLTSIRKSFASEVAIARKKEQ